ncbi:MAG TPA: HU family DNA-binding protein [Spirochaetota bacterium]|nr:HU family DNA-binding protein [Spirochaetota bacterium]
MTKSDLVYLVQDYILKNNVGVKKRELSQKNINLVFDSLFEVLKDNIAKGEHIELRGFGTFESKIREPKKALNPRTKETIMVERHAVPIFRPGRELKLVTKEQFKKNNK